MTIKEILARLGQLQIQLNVAGGNLDLIIPKNTQFPPDLLAALKENKAALIAYIESAKSAQADIPHAPAQASYPLSSAQERLWILCQMEEGNIAYNMPVVFAFRGKFDASAFGQALDRIIERHESLRTVFQTQPDGMARQVIVDASANGFHLAFEDLTGAADFDHALREKIAAEIVRPFDLQHGPLLRGTVYRQTPDYHVLCFIMHHIVSDAWSMEVFTNELLALYNALINGRALELPPLRIQYKDFSAWQRQQMAGAGYAEHKAYWMNQVSGELPVVELPAQKPRPLVKSYNGDAITHVFPADFFDRINQFSIQRGGTLYVGLVSLFYALLHRYTGQEEFIIGSPSAGRKHDDLQDQIGFFVNMLTLRTKLPAGTDLSGLFEKTKQTVLGALEHEAFQFDQLLEELKPARDKSRSPLFDLLLVLQNVELNPESGNSELEGIAVEMLTFPGTTSKFDLTFNFYRGESGPALYLEFNRDIYTRDFALQMARHFETLTAAALARPEIPLQELSYLLPGESAFLLEKINDTATDYPRGASVIDVFKATVAQFPEKCALSTPEKKLTYRELDDLSDRLAAYLLRRTDLRTGEFVIVHLERTEWLIASLLAVLKAGAAYVPIDGSYPRERIDYVMNDCACRVPIDQAFIEAFMEDKNQDKAPSRPVAGSDLAYLMYTSGTTGQPKGVPVEHRSILRLVKPATFVELTPDDVLLVTGSPAFDSVTFEYWGMLLNGGTLVLLSRNELLQPARMKAAIATEAVTTMWLTSSWFNQLMDEDETLFDGLRTILVGGDKLSPHHIAMLRKRHPEMGIINGYGPTENTTFSLCHRVETVGATEIPIGRPIGSSTVYVLDENLRPVPLYVKGEIYVGGDGLARGYHGQPALTAEKFIENPFAPGARLYRTGDLGSVTPDGLVHFQGRRDEQVKIRGYRIELPEIEQALLDCPPVKDAVVLVRGAGANKELIAFYTLHHAASAGAIKTYLVAKLPGYMIPAFFVEMPAFPLTENGKTDKKALLNDHAGQAERIDFVAPEEPLHQQIAAIWSAILSRETIGIYDDFFEIGGHSLRAVSLLNRYQQEFGVSLSIVDLFTGPRLIEQAERIRHAERNQLAAIPKAPEKERYPLSSAQKRILFLQEFGVESTTYNIPVYAFLGQAADYERLQQAMDQVVIRHDSLRTSFIKVEGESFQQVSPTARVTIERHTCELNRVGELMQLLNQPFDLSRGPLIRSFLIHVTGVGYFWSIIIHHIISDGTSQEILTEEFLRLYNGEELPALPIRYTDYSEWQNELAVSGKLQSQQDYWAANLAGDLPRLRLPADFNRPDTFTFEGGVHNFTLDAEKTARLQTLIKSRGWTMQMALLGVLNTLFYKYTEQEDIIIGCSVANRNHPDLQRVVGMFVNSLAIRSAPAGEKTLSAFLEEVKQACLQAYANQDIQFEDVVDLLNVRRDPSRNPVFDVSLVIQNFERYDDTAEAMLDEIPAGLAKALDDLTQTSKFDMTWFVTETGGGIEFAIEYYARVYAPATIARFAHHFQRILDFLLAEPDTRIDDVDLLEKEEAEFILNEWLPRAEPAEVPDLIDALNAQVRRTPDNTAIFAGNRAYSFREIHTEVNRLSRFLKDRLDGVPQPKAALLLSKSKDAVVAILAAVKAGVAYIPFDPEYPENRLLYMLEDAAVQMLIVDAEHAELGNRLCWRSDATVHLACIDSADFYAEKAGFANDLMRKELWDHVGDTASNLIEGGGWASSYTGEDLSDAEMEEYGTNVFKKLEKLLRPDLRVLEIGCSSGLTMFRIAPLVGEYVGVDLSSTIIENTRREAENRGLHNIRLACMEAHTIDGLDAGRFDLVILNSVIHCFSGHNYLREVLGKALELCNPRATLFLGDLMDEEKRNDLIEDLKAFRDRHAGGTYRTKVDWSSELFVHRNFLRDLVTESAGLTGVEFSEKIHSIENELTKFRYDALLRVDKEGKTEKTAAKHKFHYDLRSIGAYPDTDWENPISGSDLAYVLYTSGSTGRPKGVMIRRDSVANYVHWAVRHYPPGPAGDRQWGLFTSLAFDLTVTSIFTPLLSGGTLHVFDREMDIVNVLKYYADPHNGLNTIKLTPSHIALLENAGVTRTGLATAIVGGEALRTTHVRALLDMNPAIRVFNEYGPTETTVGCTVWEYVDGVPILVGKPAANAGVLILNERRRLVPVGMIGEICVGGPGLAAGYLNRESLTAEKFVDHPYRPGEKIYLTGDLGRLTAGGDLEFLGRKDEQVKIRGYRIELTEIENVIARQTAVRAAAVIARPVLGDDLEIVAFIVPDGDLNVNLLKQSVAEVLPTYMMPGYFIKLDALPLTVNGKLDKNALPKVGEDTLQAGVDHVPPASETEEKVARIWKKVLGLETVSVETDFFLLGGHSLRATKLTSLYEQEFGVKVTLKSIFEHTTVRQQATLIAGAEVHDYETIRRAPEKAFYAPSSAQKRLFFLHEMAPDSTSYNMPLVQFLGAEVDRERVEMVFRTLLNRHEGLRTSFVKIDGQPFQKIHSAVENAVEYHECTVEEFRDVADRFVRPFDLSRAPLVRLALVKVETVGFALIIDEHHIISDGTSHEILTEEFLRLYAGESLAPLKLQYKDFSEWQNELFRSGRIDQQKAYWKRQYEDGIPTLRLPLDKPRPASFTFAGDRTRLWLDKDLYQTLRMLGEKHGATLQMTLLAALNVVFHKRSGQEDLVVGCGIAGRRHTDLENVYGMFVNSLAIRNRPRHDLPFSAFFKQVVGNCLDAYDNQDVQFEELVDVLQAERDPGRNPVFDVLLVVQNFERSAMLAEGELFSDELQNELLEKIAYGNRTSKFDMTIFAWEGDDTLLLEAEYYSAVFHRATIDELLAQVVEVIRQASADAEQKIEDITLLSEAGSARLLNEFSQGPRHEVAEDGSIHGRFAEQARATPEAVAVVGDDGTLTYAQLDSRSDQLAQFLAGPLQVRPEDRIGLLQFRHTGLIQSILGTLKAGGAYVALDPQMPEERLLFLLEDSGVEVILVEKSLVGLASKLQWRSKRVRHIVCIDSYDIYREHGGVQNQLAGKELWDHVGDKAGTDIEAGGWLSSYTGLPISDLEMEEYSDNAYRKLEPHLRPDMRVLEVGCSSGLTMFKVAPRVARYVGTDLSSSILAKTQQRVEQLELENIELHCMPADRIDGLADSGFDLIIINSVIQCFEDYNYLRDVLTKVLHLANGQALVFLGDLMDEDRRADLLEDLRQFKMAHNNRDYRTKLDWSSELFIARDYLSDFAADHRQIVACEFSDKLKTIDNELTKFRYDALLRVDKSAVGQVAAKRKYQHDRSAIDRQPSAPLHRPANKHQLCYVMYTSGSTGQPKGVLIEHKSVLRLVCPASFVPLGSESRLLATGAASFDATTFEYWGMLLNGGKLVLLEKHDLLDAAIMKRTIAEHGVNIMWFTAGWLNELVEADISIFAGLQTVLAGGDKLSRQHIIRLKNAYPHLQIINGYGPTENTTFSLTHDVTETDGVSIPIGRPIMNSKAYILDERNRPVAIGVAGEIVLGGEGLARSYQHREDLTAEKFRPDPFDPTEKLYWSGDLGRWKTDGTIEFVGRKDEQVKIRGFRVELGEVEHLLKSLPEVENAVVLKNGVRDELVAFLVAAGEEVDTDALKDELARRLPEQMVPAQLYAVARFPLTNNGKVDREALLASLDAPAAAEDFDAPANPVEQAIAQIWSDLLGREKVGRNDDFFLIGGHSLKAISLISAYSKHFDVKVSLHDIFAKTTIASQVELFASSPKLQFVQIPAAAPAADYPVSHAQQRLWVLSQFEEGSAAYNMPFQVTFGADFEAPVFEKALDAVIRRHEVLRTVFLENERGDVRQKIRSAEEMDFNVLHEDFRHRPHAADDAQDYIRQDLFRVFDLARGPLIRAVLFHLPDTQYLFYFNMHHIISDGWSIEVLSREIMAHYDAFRAQATPAVPALRIQYKDYAVWQAGELKKGEYAAGKKYWKQVLAGPLNVIDLPTTKKRPPVKTYNGHAFYTYLDADLTARLKKYATERGQSLFMVLVAAVKVLLHRYTGDRDILIGTPVAGRVHDDLKDQIGFYVNTLVLRSKVEPHTTFDAFTGQVKETVLSAFEHQGYPFDQLVDDISLSRNIARNPVFDVMVTLQNVLELDTQLPEKDQLNAVQDEGAGRSLFDLEFTFQEVEDAMSMRVGFNTDVYESDLATRLMRHARQLLVALLDDPERAIGSVGYLTEEEEGRILAAAQGPQVEIDKNKTVLDRFAAQVKATPHALALESDAAAWSYAELDERTNRLAHCLAQTYHVQPGDLVGIKLDRSEWLVASILAVLKAGAAYVPIDPEYPDAREQHILHDSGIRLLVTDAHYAFERTDYAGAIFAIDVAFQPGDYPHTPLPATVSPAHTAYILYTSGSTGIPKGVVIDHSALDNYLAWSLDTYAAGVKKADFGLFTSLSFDLTVTSLFLPLLSGGKLKVFAPTRDVAGVLAQYLGSDLTCIKLTPAHIGLLETLELPRTNVELAIVGGDVLHASHVDRLRTLNPAMIIYNEYGPTETTVGCIVERVADHDVSAIGHPIANTEILLLDEHSGLVPVGVAGEICIGGAGLARGYHQRAALSAQKFIPHPFAVDRRLYRSGDLGRWRADGKIEFLGRADDQVKVNGYRIEPGEIENALLRHEDITQAVVLTLENAAGEKELCAYLVSGRELNALLIRYFLKNLLPDYMIPAYFIQLGEIPLTVNGKVNREALPAPDGNSLSGGSAYVAPSTDVQHRLVRIWEEVLQREKIGIRDDFFALGGHSLKAIRMLSKLNADFELDVNLQEIYNRRTIEDLAVLVAHMLWAASGEMNMAEESQDYLI